jgi:hypothetical protein
LEIPKTTTLTPFSLIYLGILLVLVMSLRRELALVPFFLVALYMTIGQQLVLAGLNLTVLRLTLFFTWVRVLARGEHLRVQPSVLDKWLVGWLVIRTAANIALWRTGSAVVANLGAIYDTAGIYFLFRILINDYEDLRRAITIVCALAIPLSMMMLIEHFTVRNPFAVFGGVPEMTVIRGGKLRCQGPFRHPILAGTFGATTLPFALNLVRDLDLQKRRIGVMSVIACLIIVWTSSSSGPILASLGAIASLLLWPARSQMRTVRRAMVLGLVGLQLFMKAPIWFLLARISDVLRMGDGYHRSALIDAAVRHFSEWAVVGTTYTAHWMPYQLSINPNMIDITNQYISEGVDGGVLSMIMFIGLLVSAYKRIGEGRAFAHAAGLHRREMMAWVVGASLTAHAVSYLSVTYFDQMIVFWFLGLSAAAAVGAYQRVESPRSLLLKAISLRDGLA